MDTMLVSGAVNIVHRFIVPPGVAGLAIARVPSDVAALSAGGLLLG